MPSAVGSSNNLHSLDSGLGRGERKFGDETAKAGAKKNRHG
jgi:hypothetical protein